MSEIEAPFILKDRSREEVTDDVRKKLSSISGANIEIGQPISHRMDAMQKANHCILPIYSGNGFYPGDLRLTGPDVKMDKLLEYGHNAIRRAHDDFDGIDAILSVVPYYNKPSQEGLYQHYKAIAEATKLPIILYNVPGRTGTNMTAETTLRIARDFKNVVAVKEASGNIVQMDDIIKNKPATFNVISGDDGITFPLITLGAIGVISVIGNAFPREFSRMVRLALAGDYEHGQRHGYSDGCGTSNAHHL